MAELTNLKDLFQHEIKDLYSAEDQLINALPKMAETAHHDRLKNAFNDHLEQTRNHKERLEKIGSMLDMDISGETCNAMQGLIKEGEEMIHKDADNDVKDAGLVAAAQRVEHYEMAGYGSARNYAKRLGYNDVVNILEETLEEEKNADSLLNTIATEGVNKAAQEA